MAAQQHYSGTPPDASALLQKLSLRVFIRTGSSVKLSGRSPGSGGIMKSIACTQNSLAPGGWAAAPCVPARRASLVAKGAALIFCLLLPAAGRAQIDEIQVYTGEINDPGQFSITLHNNYTVNGPKRPAFIGGIVPDHSLNGVPEYGLGVTPWLELGAYLPLYTVTRDGRTLVDGGKLRALFVLP